MNHIINYQKFNEEIRLKDAVLAGGLSLASALGNQTSAGQKQPLGISQQVSRSIVPDKAYKAVELIESTFSFTDAVGRIRGANYDGRVKEAVMKNYIDETIGLSNWFKIGEQLRGQIYQYMFQHDSGSDKVAGVPGARRNWWLSGLAQAIDPSIQRPSVNEKPLNNPAVRNAISLIVNAINDGTINSYYESYKKVLDNQYSGTKSASKDDYKNIWKYRPIAFERLMNGESWSDVKRDWFESIKGKMPLTKNAATEPIKVSQPKTKRVGSDTIKRNEPSQKYSSLTITSTRAEEKQLIESPYLDTLYINFKKYVNNKRRDNPGAKIVINLKGLTIGEDGQLYLGLGFRTGAGFDTYSILFNEVGARRETLERAKMANPNLVVLETGEIRARANSRSVVKNYEFHFVGINN